MLPFVAVVRTALLSTSLTVILMSLLGCSNNQRETAIVRGTVTVDGKPVPNGTVTFIPEVSGPPATGEINPMGQYTLTTYQAGDGAVPGRYKIMVMALQDNNDRLPEDRSPLPAPIVPQKYLSTSTSGLTGTVEPGIENVIDLPLASK